MNTRYPTSLLCMLCWTLIAPAAFAEDLLSVYQQALDSDPAFRAADAAHLAALEARPQSRAALLPDLSLSGSYSRDRFDPRNTGQRTYATNETYTLGLRQPVFRRDRFIQLEQADSRIAQADAEYTAAQQDLAIRVASAYFDLLAARDN
ncbi:MAG: TolC family protein, partial [Gammaproteobacteria bacterium]|nr:TolC family protein [Gammaproteobacteria bacterium]